VDTKTWLDTRKASELDEYAFFVTPRHGFFDAAPALGCAKGSLL
jgi:hypothetical protein